jgi:hypothetical protein
MKKLLLSLSVVISALAGNAQTVTNGNFEAPMTAIPLYAYTYQTSGWGVLINGGPESAAPYQGAQAAKLVVTNDPALNAQLNWGDDIITGIAQQFIDGPVSNPSTITVSMAHKFTKMGTDTAYIEIGIVDTMGAGANDDVFLYFDAIELGASVSNWTTHTYNMQSTGNTGTPNQFYIFAVSSVHGIFDAQTPTVGTTLWLDDVRFGHLGIEDKSITASVYPNPTNEVLNIEVSEEIESVVISTLDGKVVSTGASKVVNVAELNTGMYIYQVITVSGKVATGNFVKK